LREEVTLAVARPARKVGGADAILAAVSSRLFLAIAAVILVALGVLLAIQSRAPAPQTDVVVPQPQPIAAAPTPPPSPTPSRPQATPPPPSDAARAPATEKLVRGELPYPPPVFSDSRDRDRFKRWWVTEMIRRADVYRRLEPDRRYPSDQEIERMMDRLYDLAEPPPENADQAALAQLADRQLQYFELANKGFVGAFGVPPTEIVRRGGDPKWGQAPDPPVLPPNWQGP
jgi:hypothetical protein